MGGSATSASTFGSKLADRISAWAIEHPEATEYCLGDELEARELLVTIAGAIKLMSRDMPKGVRRDLANRYRRDMCKAAAQQRALEYIRGLDEPLEFLGLTITVPEPTIQ